MLAVTDLLLLAVRLRTLPTGARAWATAAGSAAAVHLTDAVIKPYSFYKMGVWGVAAAVVVPMVIFAIGARLVWGRKGNW